MTSPILTVTLAPMTSDAWEVWRRSSVSEYAAAKVRAGTWAADEALARAEREFAELLPQGLATPAHELRFDHRSRWHGRWLRVARAQGRAGYRDLLHLGIVVRGEVRGRGFGRAAFLALEPLARELGYDAIGLHVFSDNTVARELYRTSGYAETDVTMVKALT